MTHRSNALHYLGGTVEPMRRHRRPMSMRLRYPRLALVMVTLLLGCSGSSGSAGSSSRVGNDPAVASCMAAHGLLADLAKEPSFNAGNRLHRWTTADGCGVRLDVLMTRDGPDCLPTFRDLLMGTPLGEPWTGSGKGLDRDYVRDPGGVLNDPAVQSGFSAMDAPPADATDSGYRQGETQLWTVPDGSAVYIVMADTTERWPLDTQRGGCA